VMIDIRNRRADGWVALHTGTTPFSWERDRVRHDIQLAAKAE
jgi:hypothetical protein